ncbi:MAG: alpha/beta fold hydrolase [Pseudomonadota bacterium]
MHDASAAESARVLVLPDGRRLGYAEWGDPAGGPVVAFHGIPGSRLQRHPDEGIARGQRARVLTVDRPGCGLSDPHPGAGLTAFARDVTALLDALGVGPVRAVGISGGGPYTLAFAARAGERVQRVALVSPVGPPGSMGRPMVWTARLGFSVAARAPRLLRPLLDPLARLGKAAPEVYIRAVASKLGVPDRDILLRPEVTAMFRDDLTEAFRAGCAGMLHDLALEARPWDFAVESVGAPVDLWHGEADRMVPPSASRALAGRLPRAVVTFLPGEGHFMVLDRWPEILERLLH